MKRPRRFLGLGELQPLSGDEHRFAGEICVKIAELVSSRPAGDGGAASFARPDGNWEVDAHNKWFFDIARLVASADHDVINHLRLYSEAFSGYELRTNSFATFIPPGEVSEKPLFRPSPESAREIARAWEAPDQWVDRFLKITPICRPGWSSTPPRGWARSAGRSTVIPSTTTSTAVRSD